MINVINENGVVIDVTGRKPKLGEIYYKSKYYPVKTKPSDWTAYIDLSSPANKKHRNEKRGLI